MLILKSPTDIPSLSIDSALDDPNQDEDLISPDNRRPRRLLDSRRQADGELSDSDDEGEGGRRNHARHRDRDSTSRSSGNESAGGRKFGMGVGIMSSGSTATHGAGPSGHTTAARILSSAIAGPSQIHMDVDTPSTENGTDGANGSRAGISNTETDDMTVDGLTGSGI